MKERLFNILQSKANHDGMVMVREGVLCQELGIEPEDLRAALKGLNEVGEPVPDFV
jgi:hypothetical protein